MIGLLKEMRQFGESLVGRDIADLVSLQRGGVHVVKTLVVTNDAFKCYAGNRMIAGELMSQVVRILHSHHFSRWKHVFVQASTPKKCKGLFDGIQASNTRVSVRYAIEKIYRSWFEEEARAFRITRGLHDEDTIPAVFVQPYFDEIYSLVTKTPTTGEPTNRSNYTDNIHNVVNSFDRWDSIFLSRIDSIIRRPLKVHFIKDGLRRICRVDDELMTDVAYLNANGEYLEAGLINDVEYLMRSTPQMIIRAKFIPYRQSDVVLSGLGAAPGVRAGVLVFRTSNLDKAPGQRFILAVDELMTQDRHILYRCEGAIATKGGATSHLAAVCRGIGIPAVIGDDCKIHERSGILSVPNRRLEEFTPLIVDGDSGQVATAFELGVAGYQYELKGNSSRFLKNIRRILASLTDPSVFPQLSLDAQYHIANLKYSMRQARLIE